MYFLRKTKKTVSMAGLLSYVPWKAVPVLRAAVREKGMKDLYLHIERPTTATLFDMEKYGISVEKEALREYGEQLIGRISYLESAIHFQAGKEFNINSPKQLGVVLFEDLKMPYAKKTKTGILPARISWKSWPRSIRSYRISWNTGSSPS